MRSRTLLLILAVAALLGGAASALPTAAAASTSEAKLEVNENCVEPDWPCWATPGSSEPASKVMIESGGSIDFVDSKTAANIAWTGTAPTCESTVPVAPASPKTGWEGKCTFETAGTYKFESSTLWFEYTKYEVLVEAAAGTPPSGSGGTTGGSGEGGAKGSSSPGSASPGTTEAGEIPTGSPLIGSPRIRSSQRGSLVKGSLQISQAGAGDRLTVELIATAASHARAGHAKQLVGRFVSASVRAGERSFSVRLNAKAMRALQRHHRLSLKVKIILTPANGNATSVTRSVTLHA